MFEVVHIHFPLIHSTNTWAKEHVKQWEGDKLTLITAAAQTGGRGRFKRQWVSPADVNIYATFCCTFDASRTDLGHIPQLLALTALQVLQKYAISATIKWPNDLMLNGKKVAGILSESVSLNDEKRGLIIGIGLNVNMTPDDLHRIDRPATSLLAEKKRVFSVPEILEALKNQFNQSLSVFVQEGFVPFWLEFQAHSYYKQGDHISFHDNQKIVHGIFESLEIDGAVKISIDGNEQKFYAGEFLTQTKN